MKHVSIVAFPGRMSEVWDEWWCSARRCLVTAIKWSFDLETAQRSPQFCDTDVRTLHASLFFCSLVQVFGTCSASAGVWPAFKGICISGMIQCSSLKLLHQNPTELNVGLHNLWDVRAKCVVPWAPAADFQGTCGERGYAHLCKPKDDI